MLRQDSTGIPGPFMMAVWRSSTTVLFLTVLYSSAAESKLEYDESPTLLELQHFPVKDRFEDIVAEIQNDYEHFGIQLLEDSNGVRIKGIEQAKLGHPVAITLEILRQWLQGKGRTPVTWRTFVECLRESRLNVPANYIEAAIGRRNIPGSDGSFLRQPDSRLPEYSADVRHPPVWISSSVGLIIGGIVGILVMVVVLKREKFKGAVKRVKADWSWPLKPNKTSPDKTKKHFPQNMQEKVKLTFEYDTVGPRVKPDTINELYPMQTERPHGVCVIISNMKFTDHSDREGTEKDEKNLSRTFRYLGYDVVIYQNRKAREILGIFHELQKRDFSNDDSLVCCILSHGEEGKIFGSDSRAVELDDIKNLFTAKECPKLQGKPKLFFIQACRGKVPTKAVAKWDPGCKVQADGGSKTRPNMADFFFGYATAPGHVAFRDTDHGSWYISELCQVFCTYAKFTELKQMHTKVNNNVGKYGQEGTKEAPEQHISLDKDLYFF